MSKANKTVECTVSQCKHHCGTGNDYCSLNSVRIGTHEKNPTKIECTDCESFVCKC